MKLGCGFFDMLLDFLERKDISGVILPIGIAIHRMKAEAVFLGLLTPVRTLLDVDALHAFFLSENS